VLAADGETTGYFGALWDFIDWVYEALDNIKQTVLDYLGELGKIVLLYYFEVKLGAIQFIWSVAEPLIDSLNLTDVISSLFSGLSQDMQAFISELRIGEGVNLLLSAYLTKMILRMTGW
jgi:hypothetical protein